MVKDIEGILALDKPYYESQIEQLDIIKAKNINLERENKELRELLKKMETPLETSKNGIKKTTRKKQDGTK